MDYGKRIEQIKQKVRKLEIQYEEQRLKEETKTSRIILYGFLKVEFNMEEPKSIIVTPNYN